MEEEDTLHEFVEQNKIVFYCTYLIILILNVDEIVINMSFFVNTTIYYKLNFLNTDLRKKNIKKIK